ncbi:hypothetical protein J4466_03635 [Candidatus Pacearchaeota archaeon]|nr:hypothetical protein [Candidatus Pacearchaeota archaeon]
MRKKLRNLSELFKAWKGVFFSWKYFLIFIISAFSFYFLNFFISSFQNLLWHFKNYGLKSFIAFLFNIFIGFDKTILFSSFLSFLALSILSGIFVTLIIYKSNILENSAKLGLSGASGLLLGILAPGCAACGLGLATALGFGTIFVNFLPFKGLEISILAIVILLFSIIKISYNISSANECDFNNTTQKSNAQRILKGGKKAK